MAKDKQERIGKPLALCVHLHGVMVAFFVHKAQSLCVFAGQVDLTLKPQGEYRFRNKGT